MNRGFLKLALSVLAFSIGVVGVWFALKLDEFSLTAMSESASLVTPPKMQYENPCDYPFTGAPLIESDEAIHLAECFIEENGYTARPPSSDKSKIIPENLWPMTDEAGMKHRHDSLERRAYSYYQANLLGPWEVIFRYRPHPLLVKHYGDDLEHIGRAVIVVPSSKRIFIQHSDYPLMRPGAVRVGER